MKPKLNPEWVKLEPSGRYAELGQDWKWRSVPEKKKLDLGRPELKEPNAEMIHGVRVEEKEV